MEDQAIREKCNRIIERLKTALYARKECIAAYLLGSASHDTLWEWSDIQIAVILDDGYQGKRYEMLFEDEMCVALNIYTLTEFKEFTGSVHMDDFMWKAFSKCTKIFSKDFILDELLEEAFYIGDVDRQREMLLGFSGAVYYLNKAEKNFYIKQNLEHAIYFIPQIAENIAWMEVLKNRQIPERELIPQAKRLNRGIFEAIYDSLFEKIVNSVLVQSILESCATYLEENTRLVYQPIISHLEQYVDLEFFKYETRPHGFGINYEWLVRCGIAERYGIPEKISFLGQAEKLGYRLMQGSE